METFDDHDTENLGEKFAAGLNFMLPMNQSLLAAKHLRSNAPGERRRLKGRPNQSGTGRGRRVKSATEGLDKDACVQDHEDSRHRCQMLLYARAFVPARRRISISDESPALTATVPLSELKVISLPELIPGKRHFGRVIFGNFCVQPYKDLSVNTVLEDANGKCVRLLLYNFVSSIASTRDIELRFPLGMQVAVKEPFFQVCADGKAAVRLDNPADICIDIVKEVEDNNSPQESTCSVEELEGVRSVGNLQFAKQDWAGAASIYARCIKEASHISEKNDDRLQSEQDHINRVLMLSYSNKAEANLRLHAYEDALTDADRALGFDSKHVKSLLRKGKAEYELGLFQLSCQTFEEALEQSPANTSIVKNLKASTAAYQQSQTLDVDLSDYMTAGSLPPCADFVGPVEIRRVSYGGGRRGLFVNRDVKAGNVLLVSNPLGIARMNSDVNLKLKKGDSKVTITPGHREDLITNIANRVMTSKRLMSQLYNLAVEGSRQMDIPSMELFKPLSEWIPADAEKLQLDMGLITEIVRENAFNTFIDHDNLIEIKMGKPIEKKVGEAAGNECYCGLWLLPSIANHSCAPSCFQWFSERKSLFICAGRDMKEGEELTTSYMPNFFHNRLESRQAFLKNRLGFTCKCERCLLEEAMKPKLLKITKAFRRHWDAAIAEFFSQNEGHKWQAKKKLAAIVDEVEAVIHSCEDLTGGIESRKKGWIRVQFRHAYYAKLSELSELQMMEHVNKSAVSAIESLIEDFETSVYTFPPALEHCAQVSY